MCFCLQDLVLGRPVVGVASHDCELSSDGNRAWRATADAIKDHVEGPDTLGLCKEFIGDLGTKASVLVAAPSVQRSIVSKGGVVVRAANDLRHTDSAVREPRDEGWLSSDCCLSQAKLPAQSSPPCVDEPSSFQWRHLDDACRVPCSSCHLQHMLTGKCFNRARLGTGREISVTELASRSISP